MLMSYALLFILDFTAVTSVYEVAVTGKRTKSDKVKRLGEQVIKGKYVLKRGN